MRLKDKFEVGQLVDDTLGKYRCVILSIEKNYLILSRLERPDLKYTQTPRYIK